MSQENVEIARQTFDGAERFFAAFDDEIVFDNETFPLPDLMGTYSGRAAVVDLFRTYWSSFGEYSVRALDVIDAGDRVVLVFQESCRGRASGIELEREYGGVRTFSNGRITRIQPYANRAEALEAVGLSE